MSEVFTNSGVQIVNYTRYCTEDLVDIANKVERFQGYIKPPALERILTIDTYSRSPNGAKRWRSKDYKYVKRDSDDSEIRIVSPDTFEVSPVEKLALISKHADAFPVPSDMIIEVADILAWKYGLSSSSTLRSTAFSDHQLTLRYKNKEENKKPKGNSDVRRTSLLVSKATHIRYAIRTTQDKSKKLRTMVAALNKYGKKMVIDEVELDRMLRNMDTILNTVEDVISRGAAV